MIQQILNIIQSLAFIIFLLAGILCLFTKNWLQALINLSMASANFWVFYGTKVFK